MQKWQHNYYYVWNTKTYLQICIQDHDLLSGDKQIDLCAGLSLSCWCLGTTDTTGKQQQQQQQQQQQLSANTYTLI